MSSCSMIITFLNGVANTLDPSANSSKNRGIQDAPILWESLCLSQMLLRVEFKNESVDTQASVVTTNHSAGTVKRVGGQHCSKMLWWAQKHQLQFKKLSKYKTVYPRPSSANVHSACAAAFVWSPLPQRQTPSPRPQLVSKLRNWYPTKKMREQQNSRSLWRTTSVWRLGNLDQTFANLLHVALLWKTNSLAFPLM